MASEWLGVVGFVWFVLAVGVAVDARRSGKNPVGWFLFVLVFGVFGLVFYWYDSLKHPVSRTSLRVTGDVENVRSGERTRLALTVGTDSVDAAKTRFVERCAREGFAVRGDPTITVSAREEPDRVAFRPGVDYLPARVGAWYRRAPFENVLLAVIAAVVLGLMVLTWLSMLLG